MLKAGDLGASCGGRWRACVAGVLVLAVRAVGQTTGPAAEVPRLTLDPAAVRPAHDVTDMSLEELMNVEVQTPAGLTATASRLRPVDTMMLDSTDIQKSGARDLNALLEMSVPNAQFILHNANQEHMGFRGIISDRDDKYLYQVNGVTLNSRLLNGANNERSLPMLGDINTVSVVEGPASATHGSGALAGVVDVQTFNGLTFQGLEGKVRQGFVDQYSSAEARYGKKLSDTSGLFLYYGAAYVQGADSDYFIGKSFPAANGLPANVAGEPYGGPMAHLGQAGFHWPWQKAHVSYVNGPIEIWGRYVQDGEEQRPQREIYTQTKPADMPVDVWTRGRTTRDEQATGTVRFKSDLSEDWNLELLQSFDYLDYTDRRWGTTLKQPERHATELQSFSRGIATWTPVKSNTVAFGTEYSHIWYYDPPQSDALDRAPAIADRRWQTDTISFFAEDQWKINKQWTAFLSLRTDENTYSKWLLSPRATIVYTPTEFDTFKVMAGQSVRRGDDEELYAEWKRTHDTPNPETLRTYELSYDRKITDAWKAGVKGFYEDYHALGWIPSELASGSLGDFQLVGGEVSAQYRTSNTRFIASEGVSTLVHASIPSDLPAAGQGITAAPYGFGNELAEWAPSITKFSVIHDITRDWTVSSSVVFYSGFPGAEDYAKYAGTLSNPPSAVPLSDPGYKKAFGPNLYVNLGLEYRINEHCTVRVDGYNLVGLVSERLSKRNYYFRTSNFSEEPASAGISLTYRF